MKWLSSFVELMVLAYYTIRIRKYSMQQINIQKESMLTTTSYIVMEVFYLAYKIIMPLETNEGDAKVVFITIALRNLLTCLPIFFYSIL